MTKYLIRGDDERGWDVARVPGPSPSAPAVQRWNQDTATWEPQADAAVVPGLDGEGDGHTEAGWRPVDEARARQVAPDAFTAANPEEPGKYEDLTGINTDITLNKIEDYLQWAMDVEGVIRDDDGSDDDEGEGRDGDDGDGAVVASGASGDGATAAAGILTGLLVADLRAKRTRTMQWGRVYVQWTADYPGTVVVETVSNEFLPADARLSVFQERRLEALGLDPPCEGRPNWTTWVSDRAEAGDVADALVAALTQAYGVPLADVLSCLRGELGDESVAEPVDPEAGQR